MFFCARLRLSSISTKEMQEIGRMLVLPIAVKGQVLFTVFLSFHLATVWRITLGIEIIAVGCKESFKMLGVHHGVFHCCCSFCT